MQLKKGQIVEFDIHALAFGGAGLGKYEGMTVFVKGCMPGDRVKASFTKLKQQYAEADLAEVVSPSKDRAKPKCKYFGVCGGCQFQFMPYEKQLEFKKQNVIDSFERIGNLASPPVSDVIHGEDDYHYRNKMEFSFGYDADMNFTLGMHVPGRRYDIMDLNECHLMSERSHAVVNQVRDWAKNLGWPPFKYSCGEGFLKHLVLRESKKNNELLVDLITSDDLPDDFDEGIKQFTEILYATSVYWAKVVSVRGQRKQIHETLLKGKRFLSETMTLDNGDTLNFDILPQAFFQVNTAMAERLYSQVLKAADCAESDVVFDLFCGTGTIGLFFAKHVAQVFGIEINEESVKAARENAQKNNIFNIDFYCGDVAKLVKTIKERPSIIVIDPPRAGVTEKVVSYINEFSPMKIVYVSCNPATLARDCEWFKGYGYSVKSITPVDMFPQTYHIENVCLLER